jgi:hypothetical protein
MVKREGDKVIGFVIDLDGLSPLADPSDDSRTTEYLAPSASWNSGAPFDGAKDDVWALGLTFVKLLNFDLDSIVELIEERTVLSGSQQDSFELRLRSSLKDNLPAQIENQMIELLVGMLKLDHAKRLDMPEVVAQLSSIERSLGDTSRVMTDLLGQGRSPY